MKDKKEIAKLIHDGLKKEDIESTLSLISKELEEGKTDKLKFTRTPLLNSIGQELGKLLLEEDWKFEKLLKLWKKGKRDERLIVISALEKIKVIVNLAVQNQKEIFSLMEQWINSDNKWLRRLAVATIPPYIRARKTESKICLEFLDKTMREEDKDVKKAISWALRSKGR